MIVNLVYRINGGRDLMRGWSEVMGERGSRCFLFGGETGELGAAFLLTVILLAADGFELRFCEAAWLN